MLSSTAAPGPSSQVRVVLETLLIIIGVAAGLWTLYRLVSVILMLIAAALFAYVIAPLVQRAERPVLVAGRPRRLPRGAAIALIYVLIAGSLSAGAVLVLPSATEQVHDMMSRAPAYGQSILAWEHGWSRYYERLRIPLELRRDIDQSMRDAGETIVESAQTSVLPIAGALSHLPWLILIPVLAFFLLKDAAGFRRTLVTALPRRVRVRGDRLLEELDAMLAAYVRAQLLACVFVGTVCGVGFAVIGVGYPVLLGVLAGILEFIPIVGPFLLAVVASITAAFQAPALVLWTLAFVGILRLVEDYVIYPRLMRHGLRLHPLAIIVAVLSGATLAGAAGAFLAAPTVALASVVGRHCVQWRRGSRSCAVGHSTSPPG